jgi:hypothetical protein
VIKMAPKDGVKVLKSKRKLVLCLNIFYEKYLKNSLIFNDSEFMESIVICNV